MLCDSGSDMASKLLRALYPHICHHRYLSTANIQYLQKQQWKFIKKKRCKLLNKRRYWCTSSISLGVVNFRTNYAPLDKCCVTQAQIWRAKTATSNCIWILITTITFKMGVSEFLMHSLKGLMMLKHFHWICVMEGHIRHYHPKF